MRASVLVKDIIQPNFDEVDCTKVAVSHVVGLYSDQEETLSMRFNKKRVQMFLS